MNLNPFDLRGPEFLVFYSIVMVFTIAAVRYICAAIEGYYSSGAESTAMSLARDPYLIAYLRGGRVELLRVAIASLMERGLLAVTDDGLQASEPNAAMKVRRPLDKAILSRLAMADEANTLFYDDVTVKEIDAIGDALVTNGLLPDDDVKERRKMIVLGGLVLLWAIAGVKIVVAVSRGRHNFLFLILLAMLPAIILPLMARRCRTGLGDRVWSRVRELFADLRRRSFGIEPGRMTSELTFLAAVFGISSLPAVIAKRFREMKLRPPIQAKSGWSTWSSSCSSWVTSCGSAGSCGGISCGGGGCGGGCGGCGS
jgi:uncharacterized protein (TIGR04222 family)